MGFTFLFASPNAVDAYLRSRTPATLRLTCHLPPVFSSSTFLPFFSFLPRPRSASRSSLFQKTAANKMFSKRLPISDHTGGISERQRGRWEAKVGRAPFYKHGEGRGPCASECVHVCSWEVFQMSCKLLHAHSWQTPKSFNFLRDAEKQRYN